MIDLHKLHHFVVLARVANFGRAADQLHLTQPALTRSIQSLERLLGTRLFDRGPAGVTLTSPGERLVARAEDLLYEARRLEHEVRQASDAIEGEVRLAIGPMTAGVLLPGLIGRVIAQYPRVRLAITSAPHEEMEQKLLAGEVDFMVSRAEVTLNAARIDVVELGVSTPCFLVREGHPLAVAPPGFSAERLADYPLIATASWADSMVHALPAEAHRWFASCVALDNPQILVEVARASDAIVVGNSGDATPGLIRLPMASLGLQVRGVPIGILRPVGRRLSAAARVVEELVGAEVRGAYLDAV